MYRDLHLLKNSFVEYHELKRELQNLKENKDDELIELCGLKSTIDSMIKDIERNISLKEEFYAEFLECIVNEHIK